MPGKRRCCKKGASKPLGRDPKQNIDVENCDLIEPPHPCDPPRICDPSVKPVTCPKPVLCVERLKNPALPNENTLCRPGAKINCMVCAKIEPPHPCDPIPICDPKKSKRPCDSPSLCQHRIKNRVPNGMKIVENCIPPVPKAKPKEEPPEIRKYTFCEELAEKKIVTTEKVHHVATIPTKIIHTLCEENVVVPDLPPEPKPKTNWILRLFSK